MKFLTKEFKNDLDLHEIQCAVDSIEKRTLPIVFLDGNHGGVADSDIRTVKTQLEVSDMENELSFMILPATFTFFNQHGESADEEKSRSPENDFLYEYTNRLRVIATLPEYILKQVKDKRLLAMGYAEEKVKDAIVDYAKVKKAAALKVYEKSLKESLLAESGLFIENQFGKAPYPYIYSIQELFERATITRILKDDNDFYFELNNKHIFVLTGVKTIEEEINPANAFIEFYELYHNEQDYEMHLLLTTKDENMVESFHYVIYAFKDMHLK